MKFDELKKSLLSEPKIDLITSEEKYLESMGWKLAARFGMDSVWENIEYTMQYSRNQAVLIAKSKDQDIGVH